MALFETSAKDNDMADHVESIFLTLAHKLQASKSMRFTALPDSSSRRLTAAGGGGSGGSKAAAGGAGWSGCFCY